MHIAKTDIASEMGSRCCAGVTWALEGMKRWQAEQGNDQMNATKEILDRETGLEKALLWNVVNQLDVITPTGSE